MQRSRAFVRSNPLRLDKESLIVSLEGLGGKGAWRYYQYDGGFLRKYPSSPVARQAVANSLAALGLPGLVPARFGFDDAGPLLAAGWSAVTLFHDEPAHPSSYHSGEDNLGFVDDDKLEESVVVLRRLTLRTE